MRGVLVYVIAIFALVAALGGGFLLGFKVGKNTSMTSEMIALAFSSEHAKLAFDQAPAPEASDALMRYRIVLEKSADDAVGTWGKDFDLMLTNARLALLARELGGSEAGPMASAVAACHRLKARDCSPARISALAGTRKGAAPKGPPSDGGADAGSVE